MAELDTREVAKKLIETGDNFFETLNKSVGTMKNLFFSLIKDIKKLTDGTPDKENFKKILANYLDLRIPFNNPVVEMVDYIAFKKGLDLIDSIISRWNKDWYEDLKKLFDTIDEKLDGEGKKIDNSEPEIK